MNIKNCPYCGKELPKELQFCPYCMHKLIEEQSVASIKPKKSFKKWLLVLCIFAVVAAAVLAGMVLFVKTPDKTPSKNSNKNPESVPTVTTDIPAVRPEVTYDAYIGLWMNESANTESSSVRLEIITVKNNIMRFNLMLTSSAPYNRVARIDNATGELEDGVVTFTFNEDGWGNSGTGKIKLSQDEIYLETTLTHQNPTANWSLATTAYLAKCQEYGSDLEGYLLKDFSVNKSVFGEEIYRETDEYTLYTRYYFDNNLIVLVDPDTDLIKSISVDYSHILGKSFFSYRFIDGNSTYEDVIALFGQPALDMLNQSGEVGYGIENGFIKFLIDSNMQVTGFYCFTEGLT